jgi:hypothetical protein
MSRVELELETRSQEHIGEVADALTQGGYKIELEGQVPEKKSIPE